MLPFLQSTLVKMFSSLKRRLKKVEECCVAFR